MTIHTRHPFATPADPRDVARRLRGRLMAPVTLWAAGAGTRRVGLTVSSVLIARGEPDRIVGLIDPDSTLAHALTEHVAVSVLAPPDRLLADAFADMGPAPGGAFARASFEQTDWGPVITERTWVGVRIESQRPLGWSTEVTGVIESINLIDGPVLGHHRGHYIDH